jgi:CRISPR-associated endonuclease/helicase Cas3
VAAHHGFLIPSPEAQQVAVFTLPEPWPSSIVAVADDLLSALNPGDAVPNLADDKAGRAALFFWLAGLCATSDWIGSNVEYFSHSRPWTSAPEFFTQSRVLARSALDRIGFEAKRAPAVASASRALALALQPGMQPRPLQQAVIDLLCGRLQLPQLLVVEAPMGEGKTEAAFAIDAWIRGRDASRGVYFAMPTQATSNALFARVAAYLARLYPGEVVELQLAHGSATLESMHTRLRDVGYGDSDGSVKASAWFAGHKRTLLASNAVGTVDQGIVAVLNARHHFVRLFGLADRVVVVDEVHAYDAYTGGLIERLVAWLQQNGCTVVLMSATLPRERLLSLARAFGAEQPPPQADYPRVTIVGPEGVAAASFQACRQQDIAVECCGADPDQVAALASTLAAAGAAVLVVANTVNRAQRIYGALGPATATRRRLFHARFPMEDRLTIENDVIARFGPQGHDRAGWVVVATQVAEQSLDVDFDVLVSDMAPVDLLLQRGGRIHRHSRADRPVVAATPRIYIAGLDRSARVEPAAFRPVYEWLPVLRTADALSRMNALHLPDDIDRLVQQIYGRDAPVCQDPEFRRRYAKAVADWNIEMSRQETLAQQAALALPDQWTGMMMASPVDDDDAANGMTRFGTRLGEFSVRVIPVYLMDGEYRVRPNAPGWPALSLVPFEAARALAGRHLRLSNPRVVGAIARQPDPPGWTQHAVLAGHRALVLDAGGSTQLAGLRLRLDDELGLVIAAAS